MSFKLSSPFSLTYFDNQHKNTCCIYFKNVLKLDNEVMLCADSWTFTIFGCGPLVWLKSCQPVFLLVVE